MRTGVWRRAGCWLLVLALVLTPLEALAAEEVPADDGTVELQSLEGLAVTVEEPAEDQIGAFSTDIAFQVSYLGHVDELQAFIDAFTSSETGSGTASEFGIEYAVPDGGYNQRECQNVTVSSFNRETETAFFLCRFPCVPGTTYTCRAYAILRDSAGNMIRTVFSDWITFSSLSLDNVPSLTPDTSISIALESSQTEAYARFKPGAAGFYTLSASDTISELFFELSFYEPEGNYWRIIYNSDPLYAEAGSNLLLKITIPGDMVDGSQTLKLAADTVKLTELVLDQSYDCSPEWKYCSFTPSESGCYTFEVNDGTEAANLSSVSVKRWDSESRWWNNVNLESSTDYAFYMEANTTLYIRFLDYSETPHTFQISAFTSTVSALSVQAGEANSSDFVTTIPLTVEAPIGSSFCAGIKYRLEYSSNGFERTADETISAFNNTSETHTRQIQLDTLPGTSYEYCTYWWEIDADGNSGEEQTGSWIQFSSPSNGTSTLGEEAAEPIPQDISYFCFSPENPGYYIFSISTSSGGDSAGGNCQIETWDEEGLRWYPYLYFDGNSAQTPAPIEIGAGGTLYLRVRNSASGETGTPSLLITASPFQSQISEPSIDTITVQDTGEDHVSLQVTGSAPIGSRLRVLIEYWSISNGCVSSISFSAETDNRETFCIWPSLWQLLPDTDYSCYAYILDDNNTRYEGSGTSFSTAAFTGSELQLDCPETFQFSEASPGEKLLRFTPAEDGLYKIEVSGLADGFLEFWDLRYGEWSSCPLENGGGSITFEAQSGIPQYFRLYPGENSGCTVEVTKFRQTVFEPSVESGSATMRVSGFEAEIPITVRLPIGSNCEVCLELQAEGGRTFSRSVESITDNMREIQTLRARIDTAPNTIYTYRAFMEFLDSADGRPGGNDIYESGTKKFSSGAPATTELKLDTELKIDGGTGGSDQDLKNGFYLHFTPEKSGVYQFQIQAGDDGMDYGYLDIWDADRERWTSSVELSELDQHKYAMEAGTAYYFCLRSWAAGFLALRITSADSEPVDFNIKTGDAASAYFELQIPVVVSAPIGSGFNYELILSSNDKIVARRNYYVANNSRECQEKIFVFPVIPGKSYQYQAFLLDYGSEKEYTEDPCSIEVPPLKDGEEPPELKLNVDTGLQIKPSAAGSAAASFTAPKNGRYMIGFAGADNSSIIVLYGDGSYRFMRPDGASEDLILEMNAGERVYLILQDVKENTCEMWVYTAPPLSVFFDENGIIAKLETDQPGRYLFAVYDWDFKLLSCRIVQKEGGDPETLSAVLADGKDACYVRAFLTDGSWKPLAPAEKAQVQIIYN